MKHFEASFAQWVIRRRWLAIVLGLLLVAWCAAGLRDLRFDSSYRIYFGADNPELLAFEALEKTYAKTDNVLIVLAPSGGDVFTRETLGAIEELTLEAWQLPYSTRVDSITNFQYSIADGDDLTVRDMVSDARALNDDALGAIRRAVLGEPALNGRLVSASGHVTGINVTVQIPPAAMSQSTPEVVGAVREIARRFHERHPEIAVYLTGMVVMDNAFSESSLADIETLVPLSIAAMTALLAVLIGGFVGTGVTLLTIALSVIAALGVGAHLGYPVSPPTSVAPIIILTVAIANCVHLLASYRLVVSQAPIPDAQHARDAALIESLRTNLQPIALAMLCEALGFLTLNFSEVPPFRHLGTIVAAGVVMSFVLSVTLLPALISLLPGYQPRARATGGLRIEVIADAVVRHRRVLLWCMCGAVAVLALCVPRNELNDVFLRYFGPSITFRTDTDFVVDNLTGLYTMNFSLASGSSGGINEPFFQADVERFADWLESQPEVVHVDRFTRILQRLNRNMHGDDPAFERLPDSRELAAQYLLLYEMSLPYGLDLNNQINVDKSSTKVAVTTRILSSNAMIAFEARARSWLDREAHTVHETRSAGTALMFAYIGQRNIQSMLFGTVVAVAPVAVLLAFAFRSWRLGLISLVPNLVPAVMAFGLWGLFVGEVGLSLSVVTNMTFGIVIDDTVHFLAKYLRALREKGLEPGDAVRYAFRTVGQALGVTTLILVTGFLILACSSFELNAGMGLMTALIIGIALVADICLLPPLLMRFVRRH